jgi:hypothetical protein
MVNVMRNKTGSSGATAAAVVLLVLAPMLVPGRPDAKPSGDVLRVGSWNLNRFGHPSLPRSSDDIVRMANHMASCGVHVLAIQEVVVTRLGDSGQPRSYALDELVAVLADEHGQMWEYWLYRGSGDLQLGFMWRADMVTLESAPLNGLSSKKVECELTNKKGVVKSAKIPPFSHYPVVAHVRTGDGMTDFTLINVHLKEPEHMFGQGSYWEARLAAADSIATWIEGVWNPKKPKKKEGKNKSPDKMPLQGLKLPNKPLIGIIGGPAFQPMSPLAPGADGADIKKNLSTIDPDVAVLGMLNTAVQAERDLEPLLDLGMHLVGTSEPTHISGDPLTRVLASVPMGEEHALSMDHVPSGQEFVIASESSKGMSPHWLVSFTVVIRPDDD